jgi:hypothetical protein
VGARVVDYLPEASTLAGMCTFSSSADSPGTANTADQRQGQALYAGLGPAAGGPGMRAEE